MENKNPFRVHKDKNDQYQIDQTDNFNCIDDSPHFQIYESIEKQLQFWPESSLPANKNLGDEDFFN